MPRLGLGGIRFTDGPRGVSVGNSTCFPVAIARAATFDYDLEERVGEAIGREARAQGANLVRRAVPQPAPPSRLGPGPGDLRRELRAHRRDGRGLRPRPAEARHGLREALRLQQHRGVAVPGGRAACRGRCSNRVYLPHFKRVVDEGVASIMSAYNSVNGEWCGQNHRLLTTILKERWGFDGFVVSDWVFGIRDGVKAVNAGLDLEMPARLFVDDRVAKALKRGAVRQERVDDAALRLIRQQLRFAAVGDGDYGPEVVASAEHRALAREVAVKSVVLLRNEPVDGTAGAAAAVRGARSGADRDAALRRLAVIGRLAAVPNTGDHGSSNVTPPYVVTPLEGLRAALEPLGVEVLHDDGSDRQRAAAPRGRGRRGYRRGRLRLSTTRASSWASSRLPGFKKLLPRPPLRTIPRLAAVLAKRARSGGGFGAEFSGGRRPQVAPSARGRGGADPGGGGGEQAHSRGSGLWQRDPDGAVAAFGAGDPHRLVRGHGGWPRAGRPRAGPRGTQPGGCPSPSPPVSDHLPDFDPTATTVDYGPLHGQALLDHLGVAAAYPYGFGLTYGE